MAVMTNRDKYERRTLVMRIVAGLVYRMGEALARREPIPDDALPDHGGFIVALNHLSAADPPVVGAYIYDAGWFPRFMAKAELFNIWPVGMLLRKCGQIPVQRQSAQAAQSLNAASAALAAGRCVVIFPEGTTSKTDDLWPMPMKSGAVRLALTTGAPLIPAAVWGTIDSLPWRPGRRPRASMLFGQPLDLSPYVGRHADSAALREATEILRDKITELVAELRGEPVPVSKLPEGEVK